MTLTARQLRLGAVGVAVATTLLAAVLVFTAGPATAKRFATLNVFAGRVEVRPAGGPAFQIVADEIELHQGDTVRTGPDGRASIEYFDDSVTGLDFETTFNLTELVTVQNVPQSKIIKTTQPIGTTFNTVTELDDPLSLFEVKTPSVTASVRGTVYLLSVTSLGTTAKVIEGAVALTTTKGLITVEAGEKVTTAPDGTIGPVSPLTTSDLDDPFIVFTQCELDPTIESCAPVDNSDGEQPGDGQTPGPTPNPPPTTPPATTPPDTPPAVPPTTPPPPPPPGELPNTEITEGPSGVIAVATATFRFGSSVAGSTFECALDSGRFDNCSSPQTYGGLAEGNHTFSVRARFDGATDASPAGRSFTVDTLAPVTPTITSHPSDPSPETSATFGFESGADTGTTVHFECSLDGGTFVLCSSPATYEGLADGPHSFLVEAVDDAGNRSGSAGFDWTVAIPDTSAPETTITDGPTGAVGSADATFSFTSSEAGSTFECALDGALFTPCSSPQGYTALAEGSHSFDVRAIDPAGNTDSTPASAAFTVDTIDPAPPVITSSPGDPTSATTATFTFEPGGPDTGTSVHFECAIDGGSFELCSSPRTYFGLPNGLHSFEVEAVDEAGNRSGSVGLQWTIEGAGTPPETTIESGPSGVIAVDSAAFTYSSSTPDSTFECRLDTAPFASCPAGGITFDGLGQGDHTFEVRATDPDNNTDPTPASAAFTVDTIAPAAPLILTHPDDPTVETSATFTFELTGDTGTPVQFECSLDGSSFAACSSPTTYDGLLLGDHVFAVAAVDAAGNRSEAATFEWTIEPPDTTPPETTITGGPAGLVNSSSVTFTYASSEADSTFECSLDGAAFASCLASGQSFAGLGQGAHTFEVRATDPAGNTDPTPASRAFTVDTVAPSKPTFTGTSPQSGSNNNEPSIKGSAEAGSTVALFTEASCSGSPVAAGSAAAFASPGLGVSVPDNSTTTFYATATDAAGNSSGCSTSSITYKEVSPPPPDSPSKPDLDQKSDTGASKTDDITADSTPTFTGTAAPNVTVEVSTGGSVLGTTATGSSGRWELTSPGLGDGVHSITATAIASDGTRSSPSGALTVTIDTTAPDTTITSAPEDPSSSSSATFQFVSSESGSTFKCGRDQVNFPHCESPKVFTQLEDGPHTFHVEAIDVAGNVDPTPATHSWTIDTPDGGGSAVGTIGDARELEAVGLGAPFLVLPSLRRRRRR